MHRIPCIGHIINLAVQRFLKVGFGYEAHEDITEVVSDETRQDCLTKLRRVVIYIRASHQRRERFEGCCRLNDIDHKELILDVKTRWNSTHDMIERAIELKAAVVAMVQLHDIGLVLNDADWMLLDKAAQILKPFKIFTHKLSGSRYPTINRAMPAYHSMCHQLGLVAASLSEV